MSEYSETPAQCWSRLDGIKGPFLRRCERYAALTIPKLILPPGHNHVSTEQSLDYQSLGAVAVNHLNNRILLALFRPGDPFFRLDPGKKAKQMLAEVGTNSEDLAAGLALKEAEAIAVLDRRAVRPKLYQAGRHLIVTGNALLELGKEDMRVYSLRNFCVKRMANGKVHTIAIQECVKFDELEPEVKALVPGKNRDAEVRLYRVICRQDNGSYHMRQAVDEVQLPDDRFGGKWPEAKLPYRVLAWDLADEADYATGLVEDYIGDFEALSALSESSLDGAVLTTEMRWLLNPGSSMTIQEFQKSRNGDAIPGQKDDLVAVSGGDPRSIEIALKVIEAYSQRIARGFLLQSALTRNAERVTAEEVRALAMELETAHGGVYSQLGVSWQGPVAHWCLASIDLSVNGADFEVTVITGLEALTRNAQLEKLRAALGDLALLEQLPDGLKARLNYQAIAGFVGAGRGINLLPFLKNDEQVRKEQEQSMRDQAATQAGVAAGEATAQANVAQQQGTPVQ